MKTKLMGALIAALCLTGAAAQGADEREVWRRGGEQIGDMNGKLYCRTGQIAEAQRATGSPSPFATVYEDACYKAFMLQVFVAFEGCAAPLAGDEAKASSLFDLVATACSIGGREHDDRTRVRWSAAIAARGLAYQKMQVAWTQGHAAAVTWLKRLGDATSHIAWGLWVQNDAKVATNLGHAWRSLSTLRTFYRVEDLVPLLRRVESVTGSPIGPQ